MQVAVDLNFTTFQIRSGSFVQFGHARREAAYSCHSAIGCNSNQSSLKAAIDRDARCRIQLVVLGFQPPIQGAEVSVLVLALAGMGTTVIITGNVGSA